MNLFPLLAWADPFAAPIPWPITLSCASVASYLLGRITVPSGRGAGSPPRRPPPVDGDLQDLQRVADMFQQALRAHNASVDKLREIVSELKESASQGSGEDSVRQANGTH